MNFIYSTIILISLVGTDVSVSGSLMWEEAGAPGEAPHLNVIGSLATKLLFRNINETTLYCLHNVSDTNTYTHTDTQPFMHSCHSALPSKHFYW